MQPILDANRDQRYLSQYLIISGPAKKLDQLEQAAATSETLSGMLSGSLSAAPVRDSEPTVYAHDGTQWQPAQVERNQTLAELAQAAANIASTGLQEAYAAFQQHQAGFETVTRRYKVARTDTAQTINELGALLNRPNKLNITGFDIAPDYIAKHTTDDAGGGGGGSPWEVPARTSYSDPNAQPDAAQTLFSNQDCWKIIGADGRGAFEQQGEGVTVVVLDTAPQLANISPALVDFYIAMRGPEAELAATEISTTAPAIGTRYSLPRAPLKLYDRPGNDDIMPFQLMQPYHGLLASSLIKELAPKTTVVLLEVLNDQGETSSSNIVEALDYVMFLRQQHAKINGQRLIGDKVVLNMSLGIPSYLAEEAEATFLLAACNRACEAGAVIVAAAGNDSYYLHPRNPQEPAAYGYYWESEPTYQQIIAVSSTGPEAGQYALFSNQGNLGAPGMDLLMCTGTTHEFTKENNPAYSYTHVYWSGTSFATPLVSASAALLLSGGATPGEVKQLLWQGATQPEKWSAVPELNIEHSLNALKGK